MAKKQATKRRVLAPKGGFKCKHVGCTHKSKSLGEATAHAWTHRRAAVPAAAPVKRTYNRRAPVTPIVREQAQAAAPRAAVKMLPRATSHTSFVLSTEDMEVLLAGYVAKQATVDARIADLRRRLGGKAPKLVVGARVNGAGNAPAKKHWISAEGRARIAAAQRKRWAAKATADTEAVAQAT